MKQVWANITWYHEHKIGDWRGVTQSVPTSRLWRITFGQYFGELDFMLPAANINTFYKAGPYRTTMLMVPASSFHQLFGRNGDTSLFAELRMKVHQENTPLMTILEHSRARNLYIHHLRKQLGNFAEHQLYFYEAVTQYLQLEPSGFKAAARSIAEGIMAE